LALFPVFLPGTKVLHAGENETLPHPLALPLFLEDSPLQETSFLSEPYKGDLPQLVEKGVIRVLVSFDRTNFFVKNGAPSGFEYDLIQEYRKYLRKKLPNKAWPVTFVFIPVHFDQLLPALISGFGDIAAAGLTITQDRVRQVSFTDPYIEDVREVLVTRSDNGTVTSLEGLSGRRVYVNGATSYAESLKRLNRDLTSRGLDPVEVVAMERGLSSIDILELVQIGAIEATVIDEHRAVSWKPAFPDIRIAGSVALAKGGKIAWAVRKGSPKLLQSLNGALKNLSSGTLIGNLLQKRYFEEADLLQNPFGREETDRLRQLEPIFRRYAEAYELDWMLLAALAYQESRLKNNKRSKKNAVGIMQIRPQTAAASPISISDLSSSENNIHAGAKYLAHLRDHYFSDLRDMPRNQMDFVLASYNAGPTRINNLRREADRIGIDPDRWFSAVEDVARRRIGIETVQYVVNVQKYFIAYRLAWEKEKARYLEKVNLEAAP
ncbi:MAG: transporter substrate-binding domain-containing protein, partial [Kiloniellales bacterium]|nr:transporter substrate-binding domain-containing protein [Kiloniellales bacterium]